MPRTVMNEVPWFWVCTIVMFGVESDEVLRAGDACGLDFGGTECIHRNRYVVERLVALAGAVTTISFSSVPCAMDRHCDGGRQ